MDAIRGGEITVISLSQSVDLRRLGHVGLPSIAKNFSA